MAKKIVIYTTSRCPDCREAKKFLLSKGLSYKEIDIEKNPDAAEIVMKLSDGMRKVPMLDIEGAIVSGDKFHSSRFEQDLREAGTLGRITDARKEETTSPPG
jgi:mycoredoxin